MLKRVNILYISESANLGGAELSLLDIIANIDKKMFIPFLVCSHDGPLIERVRKLGIITDIIILEKVRQFHFWRFLKSVISLIKFIRRNEIDLVHANSTRANFLGALAARICRIPVVWHVRNLVALGIYIDLEKYFTWLPQAIIVNSRATGRRFLLFLRKIFVIYNGVDLEKFNLKDNKDKIREEFKLSPETRIVAVVGRLGLGKGQDVFLQAVSLLNEKIRNVKFLIVGSSCFEQDTIIEQSLKEQIVSLGIGERVIFTGFREDMPEIMASLDILVSLESITGHAFGKVLVEAMATGVPVIATDAGGATEVVERDITGILVPMRDADSVAQAIKFLLDNETVAHQMGQAGRRRAEQLFNLRDTTKQIERIYIRLLSLKEN